MTKSTGIKKEFKDKLQKTPYFWLESNSQKDADIIKEIKKNDDVILVSENSGPKGRESYFQEKNLKRAE